MEPGNGAIFMEPKICIFFTELSYMLYLMVYVYLVMAHNFKMVTRPLLVTNKDTSRKPEVDATTLLEKLVAKFLRAEVLVLSCKPVNKLPSRRLANTKR